MKRQQWSMLATSFAITLVFALAQQFLPPIIPVMRSSLELSAGQIGILMSSVALFGIVVSPFAGHLGDGWGIRKLGILGLLLVVVFEAAFALSKAFPLLIVSRLFMGAGACVLSILGAQIITRYFAGTPLLGTAMGIWNAAVPGGIVIGQLALSRIALHHGWQMPVWSIALFSAAVLGAYSLVVPRGQPARSMHESVMTALRALDRRVWLLGASWMMWNAGCMIFITFANDLLTSRGYSLQQAGTFAAMLEVLPIVVSPWLGHYMDRSRTHRQAMVIASLVFTVFSVLFVTQRSGLVLSGLGISLAYVLGPMSVFGYAPAFLQSDNSGLGYGILNMMLNVGVLIGPAVGGALRDATGAYVVSFIAGGAMTCVGAMFMASLHDPRTEMSR